jgi:dienelactone hydrolase
MFGKILFYTILVAAYINVTPEVLAQQQGIGNPTKTFTDPSQMTGLEASDSAEIARSWDAAIVRVPTQAGKSKTSSIAALAGDIDAGRTYPTVIYMHGCSGVWQGTRDRIKFYADNGFLVIAPVSFARLKYPKSCDVATNRGGLYRGTLAMRQKDAGYAIEMARKFPFVDESKIVLAGLSQGAITTVTFRAENAQQKTAARVAEGWTCNAGWPEYKGVNAGADEPVLTLVGKNDPWFQNEWTKGDCTKSLNKKNGSKSVVYSDGELAWRHDLLGLLAPQQEVLTFLEAQLN